MAHVSSLAAANVSQCYRRHVRSSAQGPITKWWSPWRRTDSRVDPGFQRAETGMKNMMNTIWCLHLGKIHCVDAYRKHFWSLIVETTYVLPVKSPCFLVKSPCSNWPPVPWDPLGAPSRQEAAKHGRGAERQGAQPGGSLGVAYFQTKPYSLYIMIMGVVSV